MTQLQDLNTGNMPNFCPGCGDFAIWAAFKNACVQKDWNNSNTVMVAGIGCHGHMVNFVKISSFEGLHGRALPVATGVKIANHDLNVVVFAGDGDTLAEGGNHFVHAARRNHDLTLILHDNAIYGLTTGQTSPSSPRGFKTKSTPEGNIEEPVYPMSLAITSGATFVARAFAGDIPKLTELIIKASEHKGFALLDVLQPCITWNKEYTPAYFRENTYLLGPEHDVTNKGEAIKIASEWGPKKIALGVLYQVEKPTYESQLPQIAEKPLIKSDPVRKDLSDLFKKFT